MDDIISLVLIEPSIKNSLYRDAYESYKEIYNFAMARGKGTLAPKFMGGNPIQLDPDNMDGMLKINDGKIEYGDYFVSTKANGLRFMMLIGNKNLNGFKKIYLVDNKLNFWLIRHQQKLKVTEDSSIPPIPPNLNVDKSLVDGELLFWGTVTKKFTGNEITEYTITRSGNTKPLIAFVAFDILYGHINPQYDRGENEEVSHLIKFGLENSGATMGPKSVGRWTTNRRRHVLEQLFLNPDSPFWKYLHVPDASNLNNISVSTKGNIVSAGTVSPFGFAIFVSPFINMKTLLETNTIAEVYGIMKHTFNEAIEQQYFVVNATDRKTREYIQLPPTPARNMENRGKGLTADGLILTPSYGSYVPGAWTFCKNKQYKWKPANELTIDFQAGAAFGDEKRNRDIYRYQALVKRRKNVQFEYTVKDTTLKAVIQSEEQLKVGDIYECLFKNKDSEYLYFDVIQTRHDKIDPNSYLTSVSVMNASNIRGELDFLKKTPGDKPNILDLVYYIRTSNNDNMDFERASNIIGSQSQAKKIKMCVIKTPLIIFGTKAASIKSMIQKTQQNPGYELEFKLEFANQNYNYSECLMMSFTESIYTPVSIVKIFEKNKNFKSSVRSVYALVGDDAKAESLIFEETIDKRFIGSEEIIDTIFNYNINAVLSNEIKLDKNLLDNPQQIGNAEFQNRYTITNVSKFWRIDIIEYGNANNLEFAMNTWEQKPRTRVEIEYAPGSFFEDIFKWEDAELQDVFNTLGYSGEWKRESLPAALKAYKQKLNNTDPQEVLEDLANVLVSIFTAFDMDIGNNFGEHALRGDTLEKEAAVEIVVNEKVGKVGKVSEAEVVEESLFKRSRRFHNDIKLKMIQEVAKNFDAKSEKGISLFDISVGNGGDIIKWDRADINNVYGIDPNGVSIEECKKRFAQFISDGVIKKHRNYKFEKKTITDDNVKPSDIYDIVSCQFTIHYFFGDDSVLESVVSKVSDSLESGGFFIGTTLMGDNVRQLIANNPYKDRISVKEIDSKTYDMKLLDVAKIYGQEAGQNLPEYYVDFNKFKAVCKKYGMMLAEHKPFTQIYEKYRKSLKDKNNLLLDYEYANMALHSTFIFQKQ